MSHRIRGTAAALAAIAVLTVGAAPAFAFRDEGLATSEAATPAIFDALILRPLGLVLTAGGVLVFAPTAAVVGLTRPTDLDKPFKLLVASPFKYTFMDPLGSHPDRR